MVSHVLLSLKASANPTQVHGHAWSAVVVLRMAGLQLNALSNGILTFATAWLATRIHRRGRPLGPSRCRIGELGRWTRIATVLTVVQAVRVAIVYDARIVGALPLERPEWVVLDTLDIGCWVYLAYLLWHPQLAASAARTQPPFELKCQ